MDPVHDRRVCYRGWSPRSRTYQVSKGMTTSIRNSTELSVLKSPEKKRPTCSGTSRQINSWRCNGQNTVTTVGAAAAGPEESHAP